MSQLVDFLGQGDATLDLLVLIASISLVGALAALRAAFRRTAAPVAADQNQEARGYPVGGKIERLDRTLSEFRGETLRALELLRVELGHQRDATVSIQKALKVDPAFIKESGDVQGNFKPEVEAAASNEAAEIIGAESEKSLGAAVASADAAPASLTSRLKATRRGLFEKLRSVFSSKPTIDAEAVEELRALLISADLGVKTVDAVIARAKEELARGQQLDEQGFKTLVQERVREILERDAPASAHILAERVSGKPKVVLVVGVNGVGKTTTVAKLAHQWKAQGARVLLVAADTFRAAAVAQLSEWAARLDLPVVTGAENAKPQTVVFDAMQRLDKEEFDVVVVDTAGRLQTKVNLMQELEGMRNAIARHIPGAPHETVLVVDGSTGQNAVSQAREFNEATPLTGLIVTKLDGTPKGGVVVAIKNEFGIPVRYIGVGEAPTDLRAFSAGDFVDALFDSDSMGEEDVDSNVVPLSSAHGEQRRRRRAAGQ